MFQVAYDYENTWSDDRPQKIEGHFTQDISISPLVAQRKANGYLSGEVTMMVAAGQPTLLLRDQPVWHVPAVLRLPGLGDVSTLGTVEVDAQTGGIIPLSSDQISRMQDLAHAIAAYFASSAARTG